MKLATVTLNIAKHGHHVVRENVTPAELMVLVAEHHANAGGDPVLEIKETGDTTKVEVEEGGKKVTKTVEGRKPQDEVARLKTRYAANKINHLFQGAIPNLPKDYKEARELGVRMVLPAAKLTEVGK